MRHILGRVRIVWHDDRDGTEGIYEEPYEEGSGSVWWDDEYQRWDLFMWTEGNYSCDHNRIPFFKGEDWDVGCTEYMKIVSCEVTPLSEVSWRQVPYTELEKD